LWLYDKGIPGLIYSFYDRFFLSGVKVSLACLPFSLRVDPLIFLFFTYSLMSFSPWLLCMGKSGCSKTASNSDLHVLFYPNLFSMPTIGFASCKGHRNHQGLFLVVMPGLEGFEFLVQLPKSFEHQIKFLAQPFCVGVDFFEGSFQNVPGKGHEPAHQTGLRHHLAPPCFQASAGLSNVPEEPDAGIPLPVGGWIAKVLISYYFMDSTHFFAHFIPSIAAETMPPA
jgi:hypothetical protein